MLDGVVGVDLQEAHAAVGVVAGDGLQPLVPRQRVGAVVAGEDDDRGGRAVDVQGRGRSVGVRQREGEGHSLHPTLSAVRVLSRKELTAALAARQFLIERQRLEPADAIRRPTPLQGQHPPSPHIALAARLEGFTQRDLENAIDGGDVVKATMMRMTLHLAAADDFPAYAQLCRHARMRTLRAKFPRLDEARVERELGEWLREPRTNVEIRERLARLRRRAAGPEHAAAVRPHAAAADVPAARRALARHDPQRALRAGPAAAAHARGRRRARPRALPGGLRPRGQARRGGLGRASPSATSRGTASRPSPTATSRAASCSTCPANRSRPRTRSCRRASSATGTSRCWPTPTATGSSRPRCSR